MATVSKFDGVSEPVARAQIDDFVRGIAGVVSCPGVLCQFQDGTFDIVDTYKPTHLGNITKQNVEIADATYNVIVGMDVFEHTLDPFGGVREMRRILKAGGYLLVSAPLNWREPIPDCWRYTEHGFKALLRDFDIIEIDILETRQGFVPIHYNVLAKCNKGKRMLDNELNFRFIT